MKNFLYRVPSFFYNTWILALIITIPFTLFLPFSIKKYKVSVIKKSCNKEPRIKYVDLNGDGKGEYIYYFNNYGKLSIILYDHTGGLIDQWNFPGEYFYNTREIYTGDINNNGLKEVFGFTKKEDSVFCNYVEPEAKKPEMHSVFIDKLSHRNSYPYAYTVSDARCYDLNNDSYPDLIFNISAGYSLQPRNVYCYDVHNNKLLKSPLAGEVIQTLSFDDLKGDGKTEIFGDAGTSFNYQENDTIRFKDRSSWLLVYDDKLQFLFPPVAYGHYYSDLNTFSCNYGGEKCLISLFKSDRDIYGSSFLTIHNSSGKGLLTDSITYLPPGKGISIVKKSDTEFYLVGRDGDIFEINSSLKIINHKKLQGVFTDQPQIIDLNQDGSPELILFDQSEKHLVIMSSDLEYRNEIPFNNNDENIKNIAFTDDRLYFQTDANQYFISYSFNIFHYLQLPVYAGIYFVFVTLFYFLKKYQEARAKEKYSFAGQVMSLEMRAFRNQMDPHFTLNVFNIITSLIKKGNTDEALSAFNQFSRLIRQNLIHSGDLTRSLNEELDAVESYLQIAKLRFRERIGYEIINQLNEVDKITVPKMIILTHVENAVKHGLKFKESDGKVSINIFRENKHLQMIIEDNGIGRLKAGEMKTENTGLGLELLQKLIDHINMESKDKIIQEFIDLTDNKGIARGTRILIKLPIN